jgi:subtilisin family serine protease
VAAAAVVLGTVPGGAASAVGASHRAAPPAVSPDAAQKVIVILRDQLSSTPASKTNMTPRRDRALASQDAVLNRLAGSAPTHVKHFALGNAFSATVTATQAAALAADPAVASVTPDRQVPIVVPAATAAAGGSAKGQAKTLTPALGTPSSTQICPSDPAHPLVEPEALESIRAFTSDGSSYAQQLADGAGVRVAFIADGLDPNNADFIRPNGEHVFVDYQDFSGAGPNAPSDGREAFGDASSIAAQGVVVHDLSQFVNQAHPLPPGCTIVVRGVAPGASLVGLVFGSNSSILQAIDYAVSVDHVDVINESFGLNAYPDISSRNGLVLFNDAAVAAGVTVTVSSGDAGITNTIGSPPDPNVIQVAGTTDNRLYAQTTYAAQPFSNGKWVSDNISALSSSGISQFGRTVDLAAPGEGNWADCEPGFSGCLNFQSPPQPTDLQSFGGTSESAPLTAGVAALVIQAYRSTHAGASPSPAVVKRIITGTARDLGLPADEQGAGLLDARAATEAALTYPGAGSAIPDVSSNLVTSTSQLTLTGVQGSTKSGNVTVTNVGTKALTVAAATRGYQSIGSSAQAVAFNASTLPTFSYYNGQTWAFKKVTFSVAAGAQRLLARMAFAAHGPSDIVRLTLLAPDGTFMGNSRPQGGSAPANYANVDIRDPQPGTWSAVMYSLAGSGGYNGVIGLATDSQRAVAVGSVKPAAFTLAPGLSKVVKATFHLPSQGGDTDYAVTFASSDGHQTAVSAVLQTLIDTGADGAYGGVITGGNARAVSPAQTFSYGFKVPGSQRDLDVSLHLADDPNDIVDAVLIDPNGELADVGSNLTLTSPTTLGQGADVQLYDAHPLKGTWHLIIVVQNPVTGTEFENSFTGNVRFNQLETTSGLPNSTTSVLPAGQPFTTTVTVHNTGVQQLGIGADPRLHQVRVLQPVPIQGSSTVSLPLDPNQAPIYVVPPDTSSLTVAANSTVPVQVELQGSAAGFDVFGDLQAAQQGSTVSVATVQEHSGQISPGIWFGALDEIGPFDDNGEASGQATFSASIRTSAFDSTVTTSTGNPYDFSVDPNGTGGTPVLVPPGGTATIQVTITPHGHPGDIVHGHLNLDTVPLLPTGFTALPFNNTGAAISSLPYTYKIG